MGSLLGKSTDETQMLGRLSAGTDVRVSNDGRDTTQLTTRLDPTRGGTSPTREPERSRSPQPDPKPPTREPEPEPEPPEDDSSDDDPKDANDAGVVQVTDTEGFEPPISTPSNGDNGNGEDEESEPETGNGKSSGTNGENFIESLQSEVMPYLKSVDKKYYYIGGGILLTALILRR